MPPVSADDAGATSSHGPLAAEVASWRRGFALHRAAHVLPVRGGAAVLHDAYPFAHDHNKLVLWEPCDADDVLSDADIALGGVGLRHRLIEVYDEALASSLAPGLAAAGYAADTELVLCWAGAPPDGPPDPRVTALDLGTRSAAAALEWRRELPGADPEVWRQLGDRAATAADVATFLGIRGADGTVAARADLFVVDGVAQIEELGTEPAYRGLGLASALLRTAVHRATAAGARLIFLVAEADDWPQELYRRIGFVDLARSSSFAR
jgi:ribosomal protein S18 acetylase RimI-like enzyme